MGVSIRLGRFSNPESTSGNPIELKLGLIPAGTAREKERKSKFNFVTSLIGKIKDMLKPLPKIEDIGTHYVKMQEDKPVRMVEQNGKLVPMEKGYEVKEGKARIEAKLSKSKENPNKTR